MRNSQIVSVPNGLIEELQQWCDGELQDSGANTKHRQDLSELYDGLEIAKDEANG